MCALRITVNGSSLLIERPGTVLEALQAHGTLIPSLCYDPRFTPTSSCRLCLVAVGGQSRWIPACSSQIVDGMEIETHSLEIERYRKAILSVMAEGYPHEALEDPNQKEFHSLLQRYDVYPTGHVDPRNSVDDSHPYIHVDMSRCILCYRCVRICDELQGQRVWGIRGRGSTSRIVPDSESTLGTSSCVGCGACVDSCPSGALEDKTLVGIGDPTKWTRTVCPYCGTGCEMMVGTRGGQIVTIRPAMDAAVNKGHLCAKGRYAFGFVHAADRISQPLIRKKGQDWQSVTWKEAIAFASEGLRNAISKYGHASVGVLGSARATNEENYLAQKFARTVLGTNNVDCCARVCHAPSAAGMSAMLGAGAATNSFDDIERARTILVFGCNPLENHPIVGARIREAARRGANLLVIDPRVTELAYDAQLHLRPRPGTNVPLLNALACTIIEEGLIDREFLRERVADADRYFAFVRTWPAERAAELCEVNASSLRQAARMYATQKPSISFHGLGLTEHEQGTDGVMCLVNLALLTGNMGKRGTGINPLRGQNNVQGAAHMGCEPHFLTGRTPLQQGRAPFEQIWGVPVPETTGLNLMQMMDAALARRFNALYVIGYDIYMSNPDAAATRDALGTLEFIIVQDMFMNETARHFGSVFLPAASSFEKDGTFMNSERRIQRVRRALAPVADSRPDWEIICRMAEAMGKGELFRFSSSEEIWDEIRTVWAKGAGITYARLDDGGLQWPCPTEGHPGTPVLHSAGFATGSRASLRPIEFKRSREEVNSEFPFLLTTGRNLYQFNVGTMTSRTPNAQLRKTDVLDISSEDAGVLGISDGDTVRICSRYGDTILPVHITSQVRPGYLFATFHAAQSFVNRVVGDARDDETSTPQYKVTAVRLEVAGSRPVRQ